MFVMYMADLAELADEQRVNLHSYADDSQIYVHYSPSGVVSVVQQLEGCISEVCHWMSANRLKLNTDKTELVWTGSKHNLASAGCSNLSLTLVVT